MWRKGAHRTPFPSPLACSARTIAQMKLWLFIYTPGSTRSHISARHCVSLLSSFFPHRVFSPDRRCLSASSSLSLFRSFKITVLVHTRSEIRFTVAARRDVFRAVDCSVPCKLSRELTPARLLCARHMMRDVNRAIMCLSYVQSARFVLNNITLLHAVLYSRNALSLLLFNVIS